MYQKLFSRKRELLILAIIIFVASVAVKGVSINHWNQIGYENITGIDNWVYPLSLLGAVAFNINMYMRKVTIPSVWIVSLMWAGFSVYGIFAVNLH